jgi:hypothetical protein
MSELNLQIGEWYESRGGEIVGPLESRGNRYWCFRCGERTWTANGIYYGDKACTEDLVAHVPRTDPRHPEYAAAQPAMIDIMMSVPSPPEGWQVAGYRVPVVGEMRFMHGQWRHVKNQCNFRWPVAEPCVPPWTPPAWLAPGWVTINHDGRVYWFELRPSWCSISGVWIRNGGEVSSVNSKMFRDFTPPPITGEHAIWEIT